MVRAKLAEMAVKKVTPTRNNVAAKKPVQEARAEEVQEEESKEVEIREDEVFETVAIAEEGVEGEDVEEVGENAESAEENGENAEDTDGQEEESIGEGEGEDGNAEVNQTRGPLSDEDVAYIKELLKTKHKFSDGSETPLFSFGPPKFGSETRSVVCHLCRVAYLETPDTIKTHLNGKRHKQRLRRSTLTIKRIRQPYLLKMERSEDGNNKMKHFKIFAGEDIPEVTPELEDRIVEKAEYVFKNIEDQKLLRTLSQDPIYEYNKSKPIIGLDYLLKMLRKTQIKYFCTLCDDLSQDAYHHVIDSQHQLTYIMKHFPLLYEKTVKFLRMKSEEDKKQCIRNIFRKLYRKIENKHGLKVMMPVDAEDFIAARSCYVSKVRKSPHYGEDTLEFTEAEVFALIKKSNNNILFIEPDPPKRPRKRRSVRALEEPAIKSARLDADEISRWKKYELAKEGLIEQIQAQYKRYEKEPKLHPSYKIEWSQFWHTRCKELRKANINPDTYNFKREWRGLWGSRLRKLFNIEITTCKAKERKNFNLPLYRRTPSPYRLRAPTYGPIGLNADLRNFDSFEPPLNNQQNFVGGGGAGVGGRPGQGGNRGRERTGDRNAQQQQQPSRKIPAPSRSREPVSVISVLRLLTALEDELGSLGPKSVELLGKAALCEKKNNSKQLLTDHEYYVFFVTAKEKLKGQIMANVIDKSKVYAAETAIEDLNRIVNLMDKENSNQGEGADGGSATGGNINRNANARGSDYGRENLGRNYAGGNNNNGGNFRNDDGQMNAGGNFRNDGYRGDGGNFRNDNGDFAGNNANYRSNPGSFGGMNDTGNYRSSFNDDNAGNRMTSNFDNSNYRGGNDDSNFGNDDGSYRSNNDDIGTFRGGNFNNDSGNYRPGTGGGNFNNSSNSNIANYRGGNDLTGGNYRSTGSSLSGGSSNTGGGMGFASNTNQYRSGGNYSNDNFNAESSNFSGGVAGSNSPSTQSGSWMRGSGNVYSNKSNAYTPVYSSGLGGFNSQLETNSFTASYSTRNNPPAPSFNMSSGGVSGSNYRRYN